MRAFNRTSMESKRYFYMSSVLFPTLLIEPVWNRNGEGLVFSIGFKNLLIEPVWNRNSHTSIGGIIA